MTSTFEYPSEQFLMDTMTPEPGDLDYNRGINRKRVDSASSDDGDMNGMHEQPSTQLTSTPGIGGGKGVLFIILFCDGIQAQ